MGPPLYMQSIIDRNVVMLHVTVVEECIAFIFRVKQRSACMFKVSLPRLHDPTTQCHPRKHAPLETLL